MEIIEAILKIIAMVGSALLLVILIMIVVSLLLGVLGLAICDVDYDEEDNRRPPLV